MMSAVQAPAQSWPLWAAAGVGFLLIVVLGAIAFSFAVRRLFARRSDPAGERSGANLHPENPSAFLTASMQGVIARLREQEKELERLHQMEKERAEETERLSEAVTRNMPAGLLLVNATGTISSANPAAEAALGVGALQYRRYNEVLGADSPLAAMLAACLRDGRTFQRDEVVHLDSSGEARRIGVTISPILRPARDPARPAQPPGTREEKITGALCLMSDLTELAALQQQVRWKENLAALGEMSAGIAHEFKNSLATISGYAQMIRSEAAATDAAESAERILHQTRALTHVVTEFLKFARPLELADETVCVREVVERIVEEVRETMPAVAIRFEGAFAEVPGDEGLLRQVLLNLARNAAEAVSGNGGGGQVVIGGAVEEKGGRSWQRIIVADNGPGISPADLPKIFLPFYTTKADGTGLGLALVQKIVLQHGGSVEARNLPRGAEFHLLLPLRQQAPRAAIASPVAGV
jgi:two-component system, NtrC family, sensor histidine kinase HydH